VSRSATADVALRRLAVAGWLLTIAVTVAALAVRVISGAAPLPNRFSMSDPAVSAMAFLQAATATVAVAILIRLPRQRVGWLLLATGLSYAISILAGTTAFATVAHGPTGLLVAQWGGWLAFVTSTISGVLLTSIAFVFPDGRPASATAARLLPIFAVPPLVLGLSLALQPGPGYLLITLDNPLGIGPDVLGTAPTWVVVAVAACVVVTMALAAASLAVRFRRSRGLERQQLKWFVAAVALTMASLGFTGWVGFVANEKRTAEWPLVAFALAATSMPVAIGIAILRYRLYAIDRIISRTISYGVVTAVLVAVFVVVVVGLQAILSSVTNSRGIPVAVSTLIVFALFQPLRRRVQSAIDRRFNRARYEVEQIQAAFAARLRNNVDLDSLADEVREVVGATIAPASLGLWLRGQSRNESRTLEA
jgi:hypothetical protein